MKNLLFALILVVSSAAMAACPTSNFVRFQFKGKDAFLLNMQDGTMSRAEGNRDVALLNLNVSGSEVCREDLRGGSKCSDILLYTTIFGTKEIDKPLFFQKIPVEVSMTDGKIIKKAAVKEFPGTERQMLCGPVYEAK